MKIAFLAVFALPLPAMVRGEDSDRRIVAQEALAQIKQAFPYVPVPPQKKEEKESSDDIVVMERVTVTESLQLRDLREKIVAQNEKQKAERFSVVKGGAILKRDIGKARIELGTWGAGPGLNILKISW